MKKLILTYEMWWEAEFEVDYDKAFEPCKESLAFFGIHPTAEENNPKDVIEAFLKFWGRTIIKASQDSFRSVVDELAATEGLIPMDGSKGIKLIDCERFDFEQDDFTVKESR